jgi:hypothetical protein
MDELSGLWAVGGNSSHNGGGPIGGDPTFGGCSCGCGCSPICSPSSGGGGGSSGSGGA